MACNITIIGHLGADAERRKAGEHDVTSMRVACNTGWGEAKTTTWWSVDVWGRPAEWVGKLRKGAAVTVIGEAYARAWKDKNGAERLTPSIRASGVHWHERPEAPAPTARQTTERGGESW